MATGVPSFVTFAQEAARSIATILGLDVTITDAALRRIAGTGVYEGRLGERLPFSCSFGQALRSGLPRLLERPQQEEVCRSCPKRADCQETYHFAFPLLIDDRPAGVLALVGFTEEQRHRFLERREEYVAFVRHMAQLLALAARTEEVTAKLEEARDHLQGIVEAVTEGIVAIDIEGTVICCNRAAKKILGEERADLAGQPLISLWPDAPVAQIFAAARSGAARAFTLTARSGTLCHVSPANPLLSRGETVGAVLLIKSLEELRRMAYEWSESQPERAIDHILGQNPALREAKQLALRAAASSAAVLLCGESGTGKELFARAIHYHSPRSAGPFVAVNCAALPEDLLESELFGYEEGAFTGAKRGGKPGKFELAHRGTLFLDEVADCSLRLQAKLLRALDRGETQRVGGVRVMKVDARIVAATNRDLDSLVEQREFREDLYFRLSAIPISIPPLRERKDDIPLLLDHFLQWHAAALGRPVPRLAPAARQMLLEYAWPGNVRELQNVVQYLLHVCPGSLVEPSHLPPRLKKSWREPAYVGPGDRVTAEGGGLAAGETSAQRTGREPLLPLREWEKQTIARGLRELGNSSRAKSILAKQLGISRATLYRKIKKYGLDTPAGKPPVDGRAGGSSVRVDGGRKSVPIVLAKQG